MLPVKASQTKLAKFDKFVTNIKFINYLIFVVIIAFVATFAFVANRISVNAKQSAEAKISQQERQWLYDQNQTLLNGTSIVANELPTTNKQLFTSGKQVVIYAFQKLIASNSYELKMTGKTEARAVGVNKTVLMQCYGYKFENNFELSQTFRYDDAGIANQTAATETVYKDGKKYIRTGTFVNNNGVYGGTFNTDFVLQTNTQLTSRPFYKIDKTTVQKCTDFNITKVDGKISRYIVSVWLDPVLATKNYSQSIKEEADTSFPTFDYVHLNCQIDALGNLISYQTVEEMNASKSVPVLGNVNAHTKNTIETVVISTNQTPSIAKPKIK